MAKNQVHKRLSCTLHTDTIHTHSPKNATCIHPSLTPYLKLSVLIHLVPVSYFRHRNKSRVSKEYNRNQICILWHIREITVSRMNARTDLNTCICNFERQPFYIISKNCGGRSSSGNVILMPVVASRRPCMNTCDYRCVRDLLRHLLQ